MMRAEWHGMTTTMTDPKMLTLERRRQLLYESVRNTAVTNAGWEALEAHFQNMPTRYWGRVDETALHWHLRILRAFYAGLNQDGRRAVMPVVRWRHQPSRGYTEVVVCTWDRVGLLAKVAGALAEAGISVLRAEVYTRCDDVVLDVFHVGNGDEGGVVSAARLREAVRLLEGLSEPNADYAILLHPIHLPVQTGPQTNTHGEKLPVIDLNNATSETSTVLELEARDRVGLLYGVFRILADHGLSVTQAVITTENGVAGDAFFVVDRKGGKIHDAARLESICAELRIALS
jgi:[protein-PII] uridylyltransferase